jgi:hypothetical protein
MSRRLAQDLVGLTQLADFALQRFDPLALVRRRAWAYARIALCPRTQSRSVSSVHAD